MTTSQLYSQLLVLMLITTDESTKLRPLQKDHRSRIKINLKDGFILLLFSGCFNVGSEACFDVPKQILTIPNVHRKHCRAMSLFLL